MQSTNSYKFKYQIGQEVLVTNSEYDSLELVATVGSKGIIKEIWHSGDGSGDYVGRKGYGVVFSCTLSGTKESNWFESELVPYSPLAESIYT